MSKQKLIAGLVLGFVLIAGGSAAAVNIAAGDDEHKPAASAQPENTQQNAGHNNQNVTFIAVAGKTVLEQLQQKADVKVKNSDFGAFVESINGISGGGKYWVFYVDGQMAQTGAGNYKTKGGEKIEWKFE